MHLTFLGSASGEDGIVVGGKHEVDVACRDNNSALDLILTLKAEVFAIPSQ